MLPYFTWQEMNCAQDCLPILTKQQKPFLIPTCHWLMFYVTTNVWLTLGTYTTWFRFRKGPVILGLKGTILTPQSISRLPHSSIHTCSYPSKVESEQTPMAQPSEPIGGSAPCPRTCTLTSGSEIKPPILWSRPPKWDGNCNSPGLKSSICDQSSSWNLTRGVLHHVYIKSLCASAWRQWVHLLHLNGQQEHRTGTLWYSFCLPVVANRWTSMFSQCKNQKCWIREWHWQRKPCLICIRSSL